MYGRGSVMQRFSAVWHLPGALEQVGLYVLEKEWKEGVFSEEEYL